MRINLKRILHAIAIPILVQVLLIGFSLGLVGAVLVGAICIVKYPLITVAILWILITGYWAYIVYVD